MTECLHYIRRCLIITPCCQKAYNCRQCHDMVEDHELNRDIVDHVQCKQCSTVQNLATHCIECGIRFGMYSCLVCRLFDDTDKQQFHCDKCKTCRVGGQNNFFHCDKCDICLRKTLLNSHQCRTDSGKDNCPVCFENVHTATEPAFVPKCTHLIHVHCYKRIETFGFRRCPLCHASYSEFVNPRSLMGLVVNTISNNNPQNITNTANLGVAANSINDINNNVSMSLNQETINQQVAEALQTLSIEDISFLLNDGDNMS
ncbi:RING finger and CHY zinc finger domain-containing protein 1 [Hydra vulgaris]|uniref:RING finger and CHY zinc finger domain-containing protein 1 n=1 Tax=Hydra vulgaris TaxID=6087 RepID=A0ABM4CJV2_HYDVU